MPRMSDAVATQAHLAELETDHATGCLTITSTDGHVGHVYLLMGRPYHADTASSEGAAAMAEALNWSDVAVSFDRMAQLPTKQTISTPRLVSPGSSPSMDELSTDPRVFATGCMSIAGAVLTILAPIFLVLIGVGFHAEWALPAALISIFVFAIVWMIGRVGFQIVFLDEAVKASGGLSRTEIPPVVDAANGVISGQPELAVKMVTRCLSGRIGKCWLEFYPEGLQIWRGPENSEPRWQFAYSDLSQAELLDVASNGKVTIHQYYIRLIATRPRMAFLFGSRLFSNQNARAIFNKFAQHKVSTRSEELDC